MKVKRLPAGFVVPAQPVLAAKPPSGADWVHEIKHDGYRLIVRRNGQTVRLYSRNATDLTVRLAAIAAAAERIKAKSFALTIAPASANCDTSISMIFVSLSKPATSDHVSPCSIFRRCLSAPRM